MTFAINPRDTNRPVAAMTAFLGIVTYLFVISTDVPKVAYLTRMDRFVNLSFYFVFGDFTMHLIFYVIVTAADAAEAKAIAAEEARKNKEDDYKVRRRGTTTVKVTPIETSSSATPNDDDPAVKDDAFPEDAAPADAVDEGPDGWWNPVRSNLRALDF